MKRWKVQNGVVGPDCYENADGPFVLHSDHLAAVEEARDEGLTRHECQCCGDRLTKKEADRSIVCCACEPTGADHRAAVLAEVREKVEEAFEQPVEASTMTEDITTRFNRVLELFAPGGPLCSP